MKKILEILAAVFLAGTTSCRAADIESKPPVIETITNTPDVAELGPKLLPDGRIIYFEHKKTEKGYEQINNVCILDKDGKRTCLTGGLEDNLIFSGIASDGENTVIYGRNIKGNPEGVTFVYRQDDGLLVRKFKNTEFIQDCLLNGKAYILSNAGISVYDIESGVAKKVTAGEMAEFREIQLRKNPKVSREGDNLIVDAGTGKLIISNASNLVWSKDKKYFACNLFKEDGYSIGVFNYKRGEEILRIPGEDPCWTPDNTILYSVKGDLKKLRLTP